MHEERSPVLVTYVPPISASVRANWSVAMLTKLLWRLSRLSSREELIVVSQSGYEAPELLEIARSALLQGVRFVSGEVASIGNLLSRTLPMVGPPPELVVHARLGAALLPGGSVDRLVQAHAAISADCSILVGVPAEASMLVYGREVAARAARLYEERLTDTPQHRLSWPALIAEAALPAHGGTGMATISAVSLCDLDPRRLPLTIDLLSVNGMRRFACLCQVPATFPFAQVDGGAEISSDVRARSTEPGWTRGLLEEWREHIDRERTEQPWSPIRPRASSTGKSRVLFVSQSVAYSGAEESLCKAIESMSQDRFSLYALLGADGLLAERIRKLGVEVIVAGTRFCDDNPESFRHLSRVIDSVLPDIVHFNAFSGIPPVVVAKLAGIACIHHLRVLPKDTRLVQTLIQMDRVIAVSQFVRDQAIIAGVSPPKVAVVYDPIDTKVFSPVLPAERAQAKRALQLDSAALTLLMVARFNSHKRHDVLINALGVLDSEIDLQCMLIGESDGDLRYEQQVSSLIQTHSLASRVFLRGFQHNIRAVEAAADIAILCSDNEALGTFILECMSLCVPVIASEHSGLAEIIGPDRKWGLLCRNGDPEHLAWCIRWLALHPEERMQMARRGRERCIEVCGSNNGLQSEFECLLKDCGRNRGRGRDL